MTRVLSTNYTQPGTNFPRTDSDLDTYEVDELQVLAAAMEAHDHSAGRGLAIQRLGAAVVLQANVANDAIGFAQLSDHATTDSLRAVGSNHIRDGVILSRHIGALQVLSTHLSASAALGLTFIRCETLYLDSTQSIPDNVLTPVNFAGADVTDTDNMHSPTVNPSRITFNTAGWYLVTANLGWQANATGHRASYLRWTRGGVPTYHNAATVLQATSQAGEVTQYQLAMGFQAQAGDYVELIAYQHSTIALNVYKANMVAVMIGY